MREATAVGVENLEGIKLFAGAEELDGCACNQARRQCRPAAGITVAFADDDAAQRQLVGKCPGRLSGVLAGHAVDDKQHFAGLGDTVDLLDFVHHGRHRHGAGRRCR